MAMQETPAPACPTCHTPYDSKHNTRHCTSPTCDWIRCGTKECGTTYNQAHTTEHFKRGA